MSMPSKVTLGVAVAISSAIIGYVHYKQSEDRLKLHEGVLRDIEQQQRRKNENTYALQQQIDMAKQLKALEAKGRQQHISNPNPDQQPDQQSQMRISEDCPANPAVEVQVTETPEAEAAAATPPAATEPASPDEPPQHENPNSPPAP